MFVLCIEHVFALPHSLHVLGHHKAHYPLHNSNAEPSTDVYDIGQVREQA